MTMRTGKSHHTLGLTATGRLLACLAVSAFLFPALGCLNEKPPDRGANQSLVEIGERAMEEAEELEARGEKGHAHSAYKRSLWAFRYHERLTGEEPLLMDEALDGLERTLKK